MYSANKMATRTYINDFLSPMKRKYSSMTFLSEFSVQTHYDEKESLIEQVAVLNCGAIIVTDIKNAFTKAFTMDGRHLDSTRNVGRVFGLTATSDNTFVVTVAGDRKIAFYGLLHGKLHLQSLVDTDRRYFGIAVLPNKQFVAGTKNAIHILSPEAMTIGTMTSEFHFVNPYHIRVSKSGKVIVADSDQKCIVVFDEKGCVQFHIHLGHTFLRGFDFTDKGILFLNKSQEHLSMIHQDKHHMTLIHADQHPLVEPFAICLLEDGRVVISEKERVKIFKIDDHDLLTPSKQADHFKTWIPLMQPFRITDYQYLGLVFSLIAIALCIYILVRH